MSNLSAFDALAKIVGEALSPIAIRLQGDQAELMMEQLGVRLPLSASGVTVGLQSAALTCSELPAVVAAVNDATTQGDNDALVVALRNLSEVLVRASTVFVQLGRALDTVIQGDDSLSAQQKVRLHNVVKKFDARLLHLALISYIEERQPAVKGALEVAGLFDDTLIESDSTDPSLPVHHLKSVRFDRIPPLFSNPVQHLNTLYGFGNHDFNGLELFRRIKQMVDRPDSEAVIIQAPGLPAILEAWQFRMEVVPGAIPALRIRLRMSAQKDLDISEHLGGPWVGTVISSARFDNGIELLLHPTQGLRIEPPHSNVSIDLALGVKAENQNNSPMILFGEVGNNRVEVQRFALHLPIKLITASGLPSSSSEVSVAFEMRGGRIKIDESQADGFLAEILPKGGATIPFDLEGRWSVDRGLSFRGGAGLEVTLPVKADLFGVINIDSVYLALEVRGDSERNDSGIRAVTATTAKVTLGPVSAVVEHFGLQASLSFPDSGGNLGVAALDFGFKPPTGVGLTVNGPGVVGGGFLFFDPVKAEYGGIVQLELGERIAVKAVGVLSTRLPDGSKGYSLVLLITAEGFTPIPLGFGFTLTGIGGLLGINRTVRTEVLRQGLKTGTLDSILFPRDPVRNAPQLVSDLRSVFPPASGRHVLGPMVQLRWGTPTLLTLDLAVLLELPTPVRLIVLGRLQVLLPNQSHPLITIRMDALGVLDFNNGTVALDATLYDSRILDFALTGDMALRASWGTQPNFVLAIGGLHPRFPAPVGLPALNRLVLTLADGDSLQLRCEAYLAVTSNTVQFGARVDLHAAGGNFSFDGMLGFDALVQLSPLAFQVDVAAALALRYRGRLLMGVSFNGTLAGPTPWHVAGKATIKILFFKVSVRVDRQFGSRTAPPLPAPVDAVAVVTEALRDRRNWSATLPIAEPAVVTVQEPTPSPDVLRVHPLAELTVRERVVPLRRRLTKVGTAPLRGGPTTVTVRATDRSATPQPVPTTPVQEPFALAQFEDLRDDELLARPAFEPQEAGLTFAPDTVVFEEDPTLTTTLQYETLLLDPTRPPEPARPGYVLPAAVLARVAPFGAAGQSVLRRQGRTRYRVPESVA